MGGSKPNGEKTALIFLCLFWGFLVQNFPGMRGFQLFTGVGGGGGGQMLISIEFDLELVIYQGWDPLSPPLDPHMHDI